MGKLCEGKYITRELPVSEHTFRSNLASTPITLNVTEPGRTIYVKSSVERANSRYYTARYEIVDVTLAQASFSDFEFLN